MTRKQRRGVLILAGLGLIAVSAGLTLRAFQSNITFFMSPSDVLSNLPKPGTRFRLGGLVESGTYHKGPGTQLSFRLTDGRESVPVTYNDVPPDLLKEGQGAIAEGFLAPDGVFVADKVLAKHDERYMPRDVADALKKSGHWQEQSGKAQRPPGS
jgi:cytochrome c-type biogenesis protein CcmE